jgi:MFS family permease
MEMGDFGCWLLHDDRGYFATDVPAALYTQLKDYMGNPDDFALNFGIIYSLDSTPNLVVPLFAGYLSDRFNNSFVLPCLVLF